MRRLQETLVDDGDEPFDATVLLTHFHWDHIQGLPFFAPLYESRSSIRIVATPPSGHTVESALGGAIGPPWFPIHLSEAPAKVSFFSLTDGPLQLGDLEVTAVTLNHPGGVSAFRIASPGSNLVIATDVEAGDAESDAALLTLARGAQVLVHDAQYTEQEWLTTRSGWGHSTWEHATAVAVAAGIERLVLTSHDPERTDEHVDALVRRARERFPRTVAAFEGQVLDV